MTAPFAIAVAPNGARRTKADHPHLPVTAQELARTAAECADAGAAMIHLHVRNPATGAHVLDADLYRAATAAIAAEVGQRLLIQITTEAVGLYPPAAQIALIDALRPQSVSVALREILPDDDPTAEAAFAALFTRIATWGCLPQIIVYTPEELSQIDALCTRGLLDRAQVALLAVAGRYSAAGAAPDDLAPWLAAGLTRYPWMLCAFGPAETGLMADAARAGGHARVGFENNLWLPDGSLAPSNAAIVAATAHAAAGSGRPLATADALRAGWFRVN